MAGGRAGKSALQSACKSVCLPAGLNLKTVHCARAWAPGGRNMRAKPLAQANSCSRRRNRIESNSNRPDATTLVCAPRAHCWQTTRPSSRPTNANLPTNQFADLRPQFHASPAAAASGTYLASNVLLICRLVCFAQRVCLFVCVQACVCFIVCLWPADRADSKREREREEELRLMFCKRASEQAS